MPTDLIAYLTARQEEMLADIGRLVALESPSREEAGVSAAADQVAAWLAGLGAEVRRHPAPGYGTHLEARWPGGPDAGNRKPALLLAHLDTVHPLGTLARNPFRVEGDRAYGPGIADTKGGLVMGLYALRALRDLGRPLPRPVVYLITCDEEVGSPTSRPRIEALAREAAYALVLETAGPGGALKTARKGVAGYRLTVIGRAAHAGNDYFAGVSANLELARLVQALHALSDPGTGTTVNVGVMAGGTRSNVVAERATAEVDVRFWTRAAAEAVDAAIRALRPAHPEARLEITGGVNRWPLERTPAVAELYEHARRLAAEFGYAVGEAAVGGASDGNLTAGVGLPTLDGLGAAGAGIHTEGEYLEVSHLVPRTALIARLLETL
ncbi:MAG: M20 family metallopeptidase [Bacillota bacterium]|nr:MAG: carboxypeptidase [Bacillota bacterium]